MGVTKRKGAVLGVSVVGIGGGYGKRITNIEAWCERKSCDVSGKKSQGFRGSGLWEEKEGFADSIDNGQ